MQSEQYPLGIVPPMSTTTASPSRSTRSLAVWCGLAAFGPEATIAKSTRPWPSARMASPMSAATCCSVRPGAQPARHLRVHPVDRLARLAQRGDLGGRLARAERAERGAGQFLPRAGQRRGEPQHHQRPHPVGEADRGRAAEPPGHQRVRIVGLVPRDQLEAEAARRARPAPREARAAGTTRKGSPAGGNGQAGQPLQGVRVVAHHVAQVGARREQQGVEPGPVCRRGGICQSRRRVQLV